MLNSKKSFIFEKLFLNLVLIRVVMDFISNKLEEKIFLIMFKLLFLNLLKKLNIMK